MSFFNSCLERESTFTWQCSHRDTFTIPSPSRSFALKVLIYYMQETCGGYSCAGLSLNAQEGKQSAAVHVGQAVERMVRVQKTWHFCSTSAVTKPHLQNTTRSGPGGEKNRTTRGLRCKALPPVQQRMINVGTTETLQMPDVYLGLKMAKLND